MLIEIQEDGTYELNGTPVETTDIEVLGHTIKAVFYGDGYFPVHIPGELEKEAKFPSEMKKALHNPDLWTGDK